MINILDIGNKIGKAKEKAEQRYGGFQARLVAMTLDIGLSIFLLIPLMNLSTQMIFSGLDVMAIRTEYAESEERLRVLIETGYLARWILDHMVHLLIFMGAVLACWMKWGATPGKMLFAMKIVDARTLGPPARWQLAVRALVYPLSLLVLGLGFVWIAFDKHKRGWHDLAAGTIVVSKLTPLSIKELFGKKEAPGEEKKE